MTTYLQAAIHEGVAESVEGFSSISTSPPCQAPNCPLRLVRRNKNDRKKSGSSGSAYIPSISVMGGGKSVCGQFHKVEGNSPANKEMVIRSHCLIVNLS